MKKIILLTFLVALTTIVQAQMLDHVQGTILVQLKEGVSGRDLMRGNANLKDFTLHRQISEPMNIYTLGFDFTQFNEDEMLRKVWREDAIINAQFDHFVSMRLTPDDPQFADQWQYINTGQSGGTAGADIDMDLAWDTTTGGLTPDGDTIVVCVLDGGYDLSHNDMVDNYWINHAEIPDNGIDDDGNGFTDDYYGWSVSNQSDEITQVPWHGTPVAGIIGAKGNNGIGVAGVSWDVKLMLVATGSASVESQVLEAYSYPLIARQKYNETNGDEGAFVVATNASWGIDFGQPEDSPLWCAYYDTLGVHGILNCGATINGNQNIDEVGDLPTACPSDYLIAVTNMNHNDVKVTGAGYGATTIDLGAFGAGTWTVEAGGGYGGFGGTSGATPHVTGAIGLLYAAPCPNLVSLAKSNPAEAVLLLKQYILEGVDPNASLDGITTTGGRLNINNSMQLLMNNCGDCFVNYGSDVSGLTDVMATLNWVVSDSIEHVDLRWREVGTTDWNMEEGITAPLVLGGLMACTEYEYQIKGNCLTGEELDFGDSALFKTDGCCENPSELVVSNLSPTSIDLAWASVLAAEEYTIRYRPVGTTMWEMTTTTAIETTLTDLMECVDYEAEIQINCGEGSNPMFSATTNFKTKGCGLCEDAEYCVLGEINASDEWIANVTLNEINNSSGSDGGYGDYTGVSTDLMQGANYTLSLTPGYSGSTYDEMFRVWIDFNQNEVFEDSEEIFVTTEFVSETTTSNITVPSDASLGITRMRVMMAYEATPSACEFNSDYGEGEDYCINIVEGVPCSMTTGLDTTSVGENIVDLTWDVNSDADGYTVRYREVGAANWLTMDATSNTITIEDLTDCKDHEAQVATQCAGILSDYSQSVMFKTDCAVSTTEVFAQYALNTYPNPTTDELFLSWENIDNSQDWNIEIRDIKGQLLSTHQAVNNSTRINMEHLTQGVYLVQVKNSEGLTIGRQRIVKM